ncbi:MAG: hypothetical protein MUF45_13495 [Spirosomaceae bacterium]|jgi:hypothetical protein|nr:hypothetical protein [Spirosomataceae bacterium]
MKFFKDFSPVLVLVIALVGYTSLKRPVVVSIDGGEYEVTNRAMLKKLSELVSDSYLISKPYFQVNCAPKSSGIRMVNYNPEYQILSITEDDIWSGISAQFKVSEPELNEIAKNKYGFADLRKRYPTVEKFVNLPYSKPTF